MGTRGYKIVKFRGRYWIFYNHWDSYPEGLGSSLVGEIPSDPDGYHKWLQSQRDAFAKWDSLLQRLLSIQLGDHEELLSEESRNSVWQTAFDERLDGPPSYEPGFNDLWIEWTYTIDLDQEVFSVDNGAHFHLNRIPKNDGWVKALFCDDRGNRFLLPQNASTESIASLVLDTEHVPVSTSVSCETLRMRVVTPKPFEHLLPFQRTLPRLRWKLFEIFQRSQQHSLSVTLLGWKAQDLPFREIAYFILCLAAGGSNLALVDQRRKIFYRQKSFVRIMVGSELESKTELVSSLGTGFHVDGLPIGTAPNETRYWFEGALICLVPQLDRPGVLEKATAEAVHCGRSKCARVSFNAVLISIEHLVLIRSLPNGSINRTDLLPLIATAIHLSKDARARYGDHAVDAFYSSRVKRGKSRDDHTKNDILEPLNQGLSQQQVSSDRDNAEDEGQMDQGDIQGQGCVKSQGNIDDADEAEDKDKEEEEEEEEEERLCVPSDQATGTRAGGAERSFLALVQFFEATILETLRPSTMNEGRLPNEIYEIILSNVSDMETHDSCMKVSRQFRHLCQKRPLVMEDVVFVESSSESDFCAIEVSSGRQMDVNIGSLDQRHGLDCLIVVGHEWNRKTFKSSVVFEGLSVSAPPIKKAEKCNTDERGSGFQKPEPFGSTGSRWESAFKYCSINGESSTSELVRFWEAAMEELGHPLKQCYGEAWKMPPNTGELFADCHSTDFGSYIHYIYLRLKRVSRYWDKLWDDIVSEATTKLESSDKNDAHWRRRPEDELMSSDNPFVILAIGLEVRLFKWEQGSGDSTAEEARKSTSPFGILEELHNGRMFNILCTEDRETIEDFLGMATKHRDTVQKREAEIVRSEGDKK